MNNNPLSEMFVICLNMVAVRAKKYVSVAVPSVYEKGNHVSVHMFFLNEKPPSQLQLAVW